jgi:tRNA nucleotidyltransferase/poly(A) polymerase
VRDHFLNRRHPDLDFAVAGEARKLARTVADLLGGVYFSLDDERDAGRVILTPGARTLDFVRLRGNSIEDDLRDRDFTINALALPVNGPEQLIDDLGGLQDLKHKRLRACGSESIARDPVRALRGVRLAAQLKLRIEPQTQTQIRRAAQMLATVSVERLRDEFSRMLEPDLAPSAVRLLYELGSLEALIPELRHAPNGSELAFATVDRLKQLLSALSAADEVQNLTMAELAMRLSKFREQLKLHLDRPLSGGRRVAQMLVLAGLLGRLPGEVTRRRMRSLRYSRKEARRVRRIIRSESEFHALRGAGSPSAVEAYRYFRGSGDAGVEAVLLALAIFLARHAGPPDQEAWSQRVDNALSLLETWFEDRAEILRPPVLVRGDELAVELKLEAGPVVGELLEHLKEAQVAGTVSTRDQALKLARQLHAQRQ